MKRKSYLFSIFQVLIAILSLITNWYSLLVIGLLVLILLMLLDKLGKGIVLRETIALHSCFITLVMPLVGYMFFTKENALARIWVKFMMVPKDVYFEFALPAMAFFIVALCWPLTSPDKSDYGIVLKRTIDKVKAILHVRPKIGIYIIIISLLISTVSSLLPGTLEFAFSLFYFASFAGFLYVFFAPPFRFKSITLFIFSIFIIMNAINTGMFTVVAYMGLTLFSFFFLGRQSSLWKKLLFFSFALFVLVIIQNMKAEFREITWKADYKGNKTIVFSELMIKNLTNWNQNAENALFPLYTRANQGFNVSLVMRRIPENQPFDNGKNLIVAFTSAFVPRFLWPDKPEAGGKFNMQYFAGITLRGWSTNIGPLGEAYGSFGVQGGIVFMFLLGAFINWVYSRVFLLANSLPLLILWLPVLFYQVTYSAETDTLQIMNSLVKSAFFIWLLYKLFPAWFGKSGKSVVKIKHPPKEFTAVYTTSISSTNK